MTWDDAPGGTGASLLESVFINSLPEVTCNACGDKIARRAHRMMLRASWRDRARAICASRWWSQNSVKFAFVTSGWNDAHVNVEKKLDAEGQSANQPVDWTCHL